MRELLERIADLADCDLLPPAGQPSLRAALARPDDLRLFYDLCGGAVLFRDALYSVAIRAPEELVPANPVIVGEPCPEDITDTWHLVADGRDGSQFISLDLHPDRLGRCYDSFHETHGLVGDSPVIATSFTQLLERLVSSSGRRWFWLEPGFESHGDAYDGVALSFDHDLPTRPAGLSPR